MCCWGVKAKQVNHKRVHRIYREAGLALRRKKRKHCVRVSTPLGVYTAANQEWALDFVHDVLASGRSIRVLNVIDAYTRESLAMEVDTSFAGLRVTRVLDEIIAERGLPQPIRCDNGPELTSRHFLAWALDARSTWFTSSRASPRRTLTWRASTASCARSACASAGSRTCSKQDGSSPAGATITTKGRPHSSLNYHDAGRVRRKSKPWKRRRPSLLEKRYCRFSLSHRYGCGWLSIICMRKMGAGHSDTANS